MENKQIQNKKTNTKQKTKTILLTMYTKLDEIWVP